MDSKVRKHLMEKAIPRQYDILYIKFKTGKSYHFSIYEILW